MEKRGWVKEPVAVRPHPGSSPLATFSIGVNMLIQGWRKFVFDIFLAGFVRDQDLNVSSLCDQNDLKNILSGDQGDLVRVKEELTKNFI